ncbi:LOW QUALITY PROTEIN: hypothetical protein PanWU01x14_141790 [Parasponia andersonii]|uniref:Uncharacterized protein n=1 Tax=Parasponia andersonii TaxID=3476 RepID=A0A2P5CLQ0_PARAD|nr:LOW QUALITY PROTEIN: hypothetical protein PanWU01x14_141790 [Parasponia andersonii]
MFFLNPDITNSVVSADGPNDGASIRGCREPDLVSDFLKLARKSIPFTQAVGIGQVVFVNSFNFVLHIVEATICNKVNYNIYNTSIRSTINAIRALNKMLLINLITLAKCDLLDGSWPSITFKDLDPTNCLRCNLWDEVVSIEDIGLEQFSWIDDGGEFGFVSEYIHDGLIGIFF